ncbi:hypothetical protein ACWEV4_22760 [Streptomyces sp. NPDC003860]
MPAALVEGDGCGEPERHALSLIAWADGLMFACTAGAYHSAAPGLAELRTGFREVLGGMLGSATGT